MCPVGTQGSHGGRPVSRARSGGGSRPRRGTKWRFDLAGWLVFLVSGLFFLAGAVGNGDGWSVVGSLLFLAGVAVFLLSLLRLAP